MNGNTRHNDRHIAWRPSQEFRFLIFRGTFLACFSQDHQLNDQIDHSNPLPPKYCCEVKIDGSFSQDKCSRYQWSHRRFYQCDGDSLDVVSARKANEAEVVAHYNFHAGWSCTSQAFLECHPVGFSYHHFIIDVNNWIEKMRALVPKERIHFRHVTSGYVMKQVQ